VSGITDQRRTGLYGKYRVTRNDGRDAPSGDRVGASYFVLDATFDPYALPALATYAESCRAEYPNLALDMVLEYGLLAVRHEPVAYASDDWKTIEFPAGKVPATGGPLYTRPQPAAQVPDLVGLTVSMDVSTDDDDAGHRIFGTVIEVMEHDGKQQLLAVEDHRNCPPDTLVPWDRLPGWLIDHHEGDMLTEELLQRAVADMLAAAPKPEGGAA